MDCHWLTGRDHYQLNFDIDSFLFHFSWDDLKIVRSAVLSGSAPSETLSWKQLLSSGQCLVYTCVNYDNMMNLRSKCLNSVVSACYSLMCWPQPDWDRGVTHGFVKSGPHLIKSGPQLDQKWAEGKHRIKTCQCHCGDISAGREKCKLFWWNSIRPDNC